MFMDFADLWRFVNHWILDNTVLLGWLGAFSVAVFFGTLIALPMVIIKLPHDYLQRPDKSSVLQDSIVYVPFLFVKNTTGVLFIITGILLLFLPGQGLLTILIGVLLIDLPGKRRVVRRLVKRKGALKTLNRIRRTFNKPPLLLPN